MDKKISKISIILIMVCVILYGVIHKRDQNTIVLYTTLEQYRIEGIKEMLDQRFPKYNIQIMYMPTARVAAKIQNEGENTDADIVLALETGYMEKIKDFFSEVQKYSRLEYLDGMLPEHNKYLIWESCSSGIAVNTEVLKKNNLSEPKTYEDLLKSEYKNQIVIQNPKSSSTGYNFYLSLLNSRGGAGLLCAFK